METQMIREIKRPERAELTVFDRLRGRRKVDPLRETADGLGVVLDKLSESVTAVLPRGGAGFAGDMPEEDAVEAGRRTRGFKLRQSRDDAPLEEAASDLEAEAGSVYVSTEDTAPAGELAAGEEVAKEVDDVIDILREARDVAADAVAPPVVMPAHDRAAAQAKLKELFAELGMKRIEIISAIFKGGPEEASGAADLFSLATIDGAKAAYKGIDAMIMKFLNAGRDDTAVGAGSVYEGHEAAMSATERLKEYLRNESPEKAFMRFREVNRSNILGLLQ